jgi:hypothetical protein
MYALTNYIKTAAVKEKNVTLSHLAFRVILKLLPEQSRRLQQVSLSPLGPIKKIIIMRLHFEARSFYKYKTITTQNSFISSSIHE